LRIFLFNEWEEVYTKLFDRYDDLRKDNKFLKNKTNNMAHDASSKKKNECLEQEVLNLKEKNEELEKDINEMNLKMEELEK